MFHTREDSSASEKDDSRSTLGVASGTLPGTFRTSFKTAIANRKSAMLLLSQAKANKLRTLCSFLPTIVLRKLSRLTREEALDMRPEREAFHQCAVVMLDMCGFTQLSEGLGQGKLLLHTEATQFGSGGQASRRSASNEAFSDRGLANSYDKTMMSARLLRLQTSEEAQAGFGAEQLKVLLNAFFKILMSTITQHGGDVLRLAGDALIVVFADGNGQRDVPNPSLLRRAALVSALCLERLDGMAIQDLATAMDDGTAGEMVVSANYWKEMSKTSEGPITADRVASSDDNGSNNIYEDDDRPMAASDIMGGVEWRWKSLITGNVKVKAAAGGAEMEAALQREYMLGGEGGTSENETRNIREMDFLERVIRRFIPPPILYVCEAEEGGWFAEIGRVGVIFVNIAINGVPDVEVMQNVFLVLQRAMKSNQGIIKEFSVDDKGTVMVGVVGLPPVTGSNPSVRACVIALEIVSGMQALGIESYVGISFGPVFTASIGGARREFMLVGDVVNTAARLMSVGKKMRAESLASFTRPSESSDGVRPTGARLSSGVIVVDSVTAELARCVLEFEKLGKVSVKGKAIPVDVFSPLKPTAYSRSDGVRFAVIGHTELRAALLEKVSSLVQGFGGGLLILQGEPGVGKTRLIDECGREWQRERFKTLGLHHASQTLHSGAPFSAWKGVMYSVLLLCRSAVLAAPNTDSAYACALASSNTVVAEDDSRGLEDLRRVVEAIDDHHEGRGDPGHERNVHETLESSVPSVSEDANWTKDQPNDNADDAAVETDGAIPSTAEGGFKDPGWTVAGREVAAIQAQSVQAMVERLHSEMNVLRSLYSTPSTTPATTPRSIGQADEQGHSQNKRNHGPTAQSKDHPEDHVEVEHGGEKPAEQPKCQPEGCLTVEDNIDGRSAIQAENIGKSILPEARNDERSEEDGARVNDSDPGVREDDPFVNSDNQQVPVVSGTEAAVLPWWAGAFGAVQDMEDGCEARGLYTRRFCELFFPDKTDEATEVLCSLLDGMPPATGDTLGAPTTSARLLNLSMRGSDASVSDASEAAEEYASTNNEGQQPVPVDVPESATSRNSGRQQAGNGAAEGGEPTVPYPEKARFDILLGMLTIATMVGDNEAVPSGTEDGQMKVGETGVTEEDTGKPQGGAAEGRDSGQTNMGGGQGVITVLDNSHEMDRCSCDLVKASMKYLHERLLVLLIAPPLPAIVSTNRHGSTAGSTSSDGKCSQEAHDDEISTDGSSSNSGGGESVFSELLPMFPSDALQYVQKYGRSTDTICDDSNEQHNDGGDDAKKTETAEHGGGDDSVSADGHRNTVNDAERKAGVLRDDNCTLDGGGNKVRGGVEAGGGGGGGAGTVHSGGGSGREGNRGRRSTQRNSNLFGNHRQKKEGARLSAGGNTHLQIGAAAFMEAGHSSKRGTALPRGLSMQQQKGRRDSGFTRYWNRGTMKLWDILASLRPNITLETVRVEPLRYSETVELGCRHLGCDELDPLVGVALYLRTNGNPLYIIGYCHLMLERSLGEVVLSSAPRSKQSNTPPPCPDDTNETPLDQRDCETNAAGGGERKTRNKEEVDGEICEVQVQATAAGVSTEEIAPTERQRAGPGRGTDFDHETTRPTKSDTTVFRLKENMNVFKVLEGIIPESVESRITAFLGCLSAQQVFILRVMSVIGTGGIDSDLLEAVYPIPVLGSTIRDDLEALEACQLVKIERVAPLPSHLLPATGVSTASRAAELTKGTGREPMLGKDEPVRISKLDDCIEAAASAAKRKSTGRLLLSFRDLVLRQVVYMRVSHNNRKKLHGNIADWLAERQRQIARKQESGETADGSGQSRSRRRRSSFEFGKAAAKGRVLATPTQSIPLQVHHLTMSHQEQKAMIRAHLYGTQELEQWAMGAFAAMLEKRAACVPHDLLAVAKECKDFMWLSPNLIGILKTLLAIRSGTGVSNATSKFRHTIISSRAERSGSAHGGASCNTDPTFPDTEEEGNEGAEGAEDSDGPPGAESPARIDGTISDERGKTGGRQSQGDSSPQHAHSMPVPTGPPATFMSGMLAERPHTSRGPLPSASRVRGLDIHPCAPQRIRKATSAATTRRTGGRGYNDNESVQRRLLQHPLRASNLSCASLADIYSAYPLGMTRGAISRSIIVHNSGTATPSGVLIFVTRRSLARTRVAPAAAGIRQSRHLNGGAANCTNNNTSKNKGMFEQGRSVGGHGGHSLMSTVQSMKRLAWKPDDNPGICGGGGRGGHAASRRQRRTITARASTGKKRVTTTAVVDDRTSTHILSPTRECSRLVNLHKVYGGGNGVTIPAASGSSPKGVAYPVVFGSNKERAKTRNGM